MSSPVEQIKSKLSIVDVVSSYIKLEKAGSNYKARCPFHNEKTPSFHVSPSRDAYHCFGCNRGGDIFTFTQEIEGLDFLGALRMLAEKAGVELKREDPKKRSEMERLYSIMTDATRFYSDHIHNASGVQKYLHDRGVRDETIERFALGYAPNEWTSVMAHLKSKGYSDVEIEKVGLAKRSERKPETMYDRFRGRVIFPIADAVGRVVGFSGRLFEGDEKESAKYINSPDTVLYDKSSVLYGYDKAKTAIRKQNFCIIVEGQVDLLMAHQSGTENTVAVSGTALSEKHLGLIKRLTDNIVFAFDADDAGLSAAGRGFELALKQGMNVRVAALPDGSDPADVIKEDVKTWNNAILQSKHIIELYLDRFVEKKYNEMEVSQKVLPYLALIPNKIEQTQFAIELARKIGFPEEKVWEEMQKHTVAQSVAGYPEMEEMGVVDAMENIRNRSRRELIEIEILSLIFWQEDAEGSQIDISVARERYEGIMQEKSLFKRNIPENKKNKLIIKAENTYTKNTKLKGEMDVLLLDLEKEVLKERLNSLTAQMRDAENRGDKKASSEYLNNIQEVTMRMNEIEGKKIELVN